MDVHHTEIGRALPGQQSRRNFRHPVKCIRPRRLATSFGQGEDRQHQPCSRMKEKSSSAGRPAFKNRPFEGEYSSLGDITFRAHILVTCSVYHSFKYSHHRRSSLLTWPSQIHTSLLQYATPSTSDMHDTGELRYDGRELRLH